MPPKKSEAKELKALDAYFKKAIKELAGYPARQLFDYSKLFNFFTYHINNIGDPFLGPSNYRINTLEIEREVIDEFARMFHAPKDEYWGYVTNGGTESNLYGLYQARELHPEGVVFFSDQTHYSIEKNLHILRMPHVKVAASVNGEIDYQALQQALFIEKRTPIIVANIGTTMKGAVDDVVRIKEILSDLKIKQYYIHCDAAFFGMILPFLPELEVQPFDFRMNIDSIAISGHKMIGTPMPCGVILTNKKNHERMGSHIEYTGSKDSTISGSRNGLAPLFLWHELCCARKKGFEKLISGCIDKAGYTVKKFNEHGIAAWRNKNSVIVIFPKPSPKTIKRWQLATEGPISHIITLTHLSYKTIDQVVSQVALDLSPKKPKKQSGR
ncbi:MAG: histidine decarboxylase [Chlamydiae bacterium]|nr:histidine decarboxylase [Chlamydiota bacterium]